MTYGVPVCLILRRPLADDTVHAAEAPQDPGLETWTYWYHTLSQVLTLRVVAAGKRRE